MTRLCKIQVKPKDSKYNDFTQALAEYFCKEFKINGLNAKNFKSYVEVKLDKLYKKYSSVIVDCINGKMFLRGKDCKDKYFGRLSKFNLKHQADAYNCVNYNATRIINRIKNLYNNLTIEKEAEVLFKDLREPIGQIPLYGIPLEEQEIYIYDLRNENSDCDCIYDDRCEECDCIYDCRCNNDNCIEEYICDCRIPEPEDEILFYDMRNVPEIYIFADNKMFNKIKNGIINGISKLISAVTDRG